MICHECHKWWRVPESGEYEQEEVWKVVKCNEVLLHMEFWENWQMFQNEAGVELEVYEP